MSDQTTPASLLQQIEGLEPFFRFRRALRRADQLVLDDLIQRAQEHIKTAVTVDKDLLPTEAMLISLLLEEHKEVKRIRSMIEALLPPEEP